MPKDVLDRRVQKTRQLLQEALVTLISEKGFESVRIQDILDRANVGRSTFYMHFENKYELLHSCFDDMRTLFEEHILSISHSRKQVEDLDETDFILRLFRFVERNHRLFKALLGKDGVMFNSPFHDYVLTFIRKILKNLASNGKQAPLQLEMLAHYLSNAFIGTLKWWVDHDMPFTAEDMDRYFKKLIKHDIKEVLG